MSACARMEIGRLCRTGLALGCSSFCAEDFRSKGTGTGFGKGRGFVQEGRGNGKAVKGPKARMAQGQSL